MSLFKKAEQKDARVKACFYGAPGVGKTVAALQFPNPVVIDLEKGTVMYGNAYNFHVLHTQKLSEVDQAINELMVDPGDYTTLIIDPISVYCDLVQQKVLNEKIKLTGDPNAQLKGLDYVPVKNQIRRFVRKLLSLDMNIVVTAREKPTYEEGKFMKQNGVTPDLQKEVPYMFDTVVRIYIDGDGQRIGIAQADIEPGTVAKDRTNLPKDRFVFSYENLEKYWGAESLGRKAAPVTVDPEDDDTINDKGTTAGITEEQVTIIATKTASAPEKFKKYLLTNYGVSAVTDLREDEAATIINSFK